MGSEDEVTPVEREVGDIDLVPGGTNELEDIPDGYSHCNQCGELTFDSVIEATGGYCLTCRERN